MKLYAKVVACAVFLLAAVPARTQFLPPEIYDHYEGPLQIVRGKHADEMLSFCPMVAAMGYPRLGCAYAIKDGGCLIVMATDQAIKATGHDPEIVLRHELGHCAGWGADHSGAR